MAIMTVRSTYALDRETVDTLDRLARQWNVSKSEALRRAVRAAADASDSDARWRAFDELKKSLNLSEADAKRWVQEVRDERRAAGEKRLRPR